MERAIEGQNLDPGALTSAMFAPNGRLGHLKGRIEFPQYPGYSVSLSEVIDIDRGPDPRSKYAYQLFGPHDSIWGYHRDPRKEPELVDHFHISAHSRVPERCGLYLAEMFTKAWMTLDSFHTVHGGR